MNCFLRYWVNSDHDMFRTMILDVLPGRLDMQRLLKDIVAVETTRFGKLFTLIAAKFPSSRQHKVLSIALLNGTLTLHTFAPDEPFKYFLKTAESFCTEYEVLKLLNQKRDLEKQLERTTDSVELEARIQNLNDEMNSIVESSDSGIAFVF